MSSIWLLYLSFSPVIMNVEVLYLYFLCLAIAEVYNNEGDSEYSKGEYNSAIDQYTEGIKVNCKDENLNASLFTNRATVYLHLGENLLFKNSLLFFLVVL